MKKLSLSLDKGKKYLLGLSGGADSVCLFHLLRSGAYDFAAAHINHSIRGAEAKRDEDFCRELCNFYGIEFFTEDFDVPAIARESGESLEEAARNVRYAFFEKIMRAEGISVLLTAHNADDNAETLLLSLTRGCTLSGACGIAPKRQLAFGEVERPLLKYSKGEITDFCLSGAFDFVTDSTNTDTSYPRNRVRQDILPELYKINPEFLAAFARFTEAARLDSELLNSEAEKFADNLDCRTLASLPYPIASRAVAIAAHRAGALPEAVHIEKMLEIAKNERGSISLPGVVRAEFKCGKIIFCADSREKDAEAYPFFEPLGLKEGENHLPCGKLILVTEVARIINQSTSAHLDAEKIKGSLYARPRREGDRILIRGMHRSVKKLISQNLSAMELTARRALPVICKGEEIVWIPGLEVADPYRGNTGAVYYLSEGQNETDT